MLIVITNYFFLFFSELQKQKSDKEKEEEGICNMFDIKTFKNISEVHNDIKVWVFSEKEHRNEGIVQS